MSFCDPKFLWNIYFKTTCTAITLDRFLNPCFDSQDLEETPGKVNESPSEHGWFMKIRVGSEGKSSFEKLLDEVAYKKHVDDSAH